MEEDGNNMLTMLTHLSKQAYIGSLMISVNRLVEGGGELTATLQIPNKYRCKLDSFPLKIKVVLVAILKILIKYLCYDIPFKN